MRILPNTCVKQNIIMINKYQSVIFGNWKILFKITFKRLLTHLIDQLIGREGHSHPLKDYFECNTLNWPTGKKAHSYIMSLNKDK